MAVPGGLLDKGIVTNEKKLKSISPWAAGYPYQDKSKIR
jgi:hypothetical protein